jgi:hypothetical protein
MDKARVKWNSGHLAILCSGCSKIIKVGFEFTDEEANFARGNGHLDPQYCEDCSLKVAKQDNLSN